jgi:hypothetical protein
MADAFYFSGTPATTGLPEMSVNAALQGSVYITPNIVVGFATKPGTGA